MKITDGPRKFYKVVGAKGQALKWIKYEVPNKYRFYEDGAWYVHEKHIDDIKQLGSPSVQYTPCSGTDDFAVLHLRNTAPMAIVDAAWRALAKLHHPDKGGSEEEFKRISAAYHRIKGKVNE